MNVEIIRKKDMFCKETALSTICNYYKTPYQLLFSDTWEFDYEENDLSIGNNIIVNDWDLFGKLSRLGIKKGKVEEFDKKDIGDINNKIKQGKLAIICLDMVAFNKMNGTSYLGLLSPYLLFDYENGYLVYDLHYTHENMKLSKEVFESTCKTIVFYDVEIKNTPFVFQYNIEEIRGLVIPSRPNFEKIEKLATLFYNGSVDLQYEMKDLKDGDNPVESPLVNKIETLARGRNMFSIYLDYINKMIPEINITEACEKISYWAGKWNLIKVTLIKSYLRNNFSSNVTKKIAFIMSEIAKGEEDLYNWLLQVNITSAGLRKNAVEKDTCTQVKDTYQNNQNGMLIDLSKYYNNAAIRITGSEKNADMTGLGAYIEYDEEQLIKLECELKDYFGLRNIITKSFDNIMCEKQEISVPDKVYKKICILGCSDYGSFSDYLTIYYENNKTNGKKVFIQFSSWINKKPLFDEEVYCTGKLREKNVLLSQSSGTLFSQIIEVENKKIKAIKLPDCPTMHIFSIYLI